MRKFSILLAAAVCAALIGLYLSAIADGVGFKDTPFLPGNKWRVHDADRPVPREVTPAETFSQGAKPPSDAVVLFDGKDLSQWRRDAGEARWKVENGYMEVVKDSGTIRTKDEFGDFQLHLEFASPEKVSGDSQGRGNSGVILHGRYEVQVLDSYHNPTYPDGQTGAMYGQYPPLVNAVKKPGEWQSYDIIFESDRYDGDGKLVKPASVTVILNGVVLHHKQAYLGPVRHKEVASYGKAREPRGPIVLQDHGNPVRFRNIWIRNLGEYDKP